MRTWTVAAVVWLCVVLAAPAAAAPGQTIYTYTNAQGRKVYVNGIERVPKAFRAKAKPVDLSHVSLNRKVGMGLEEHVRDVYGKLVRSKFCARARASGGEGFVARVWREHGAMVVIGGFALLLLVASPWIARRTSVPNWGRVLMIALPLLVTLGAITMAASRTSRALGVVRHTAELCTDDGKKKSTAEQLSVIKALRVQLEKAEAKRRAQLDRVTR
ncbi:MAG: hypothetical protein KC503_39525 [Myxococcales bacterium]|nr:hypothetical protein [Myxococcales bacterium]